MATLSPEAQRRFAIELVRRLREAGFQAYWAGGCVRDRLMGRIPKDYDVATDARPEQVRRLFGYRRTIAVGAAFGVIAVIGPKEAGQVEVVTFRHDDSYSDGRHPDHVTFSSPAEDAARRDFTINGLFYDPLDERVLDFVGGQEDLARGQIRAIGDPHQRFQEDKLRLLRAVRFAAVFQFDVEPNTLEAVARMAPQITVVSAERIAAEMERMLADRHRGRAVRLLLQTGLAAAVLPEIVADDEAGQARQDAALAVLDRLGDAKFPLALATLLHRSADAEGLEAICRRWRLSNHQTNRATWLVEHQAALREARAMPWSKLQPLLISEGIADLLVMEEAMALADSRPIDHVAWCRSLVTQPPETLNPPPLVTGDDLLRHGIRPGPHFRFILQRLRDAQLDAEIQTKIESLELADRLWKTAPWTKSSRSE